MKEEILMKENEEIEIRLDDLLWFILKGWKAAIIAAIIGGALLGGFKYVSNMKAAEMTDESFVESFAESHPDIKEARMEELDLSAKTIKKYKDQIKNQEEYTGDSLLQKIDWTKVCTGRASYMVQMSGAADAAKLVTLGESFIERLNSDEYYDEAARGLNAESSYIDELFIATYSIPQINFSVIDDGDSSSGNTLANTDTLIINLTATAVDRSDAEIMLSSADSVIQNISSDLSDKVVPNTAKLVSTTFNVNRDTTLRDKQINELIVAARGYYDLIAAEEEDLSADELAYVNAKLAVLGGNDENEAEDLNGLPVKFIAIGIIAGIFIVLLYRAAMYVIAGKLSSPFEMEDRAGIRTYFRHDNEKSIKGIDGLLFKWRFGSRKIVDAKTVAGIIAMEAASLEGQKAVKKLLITGTFEGFSEDECVKELNVLLKKNGIEAVSGAQIVYSPELIKDAAGSDAAVIFEKLGESGRDMVREELRYLDGHSLPVMAAVVSVN